MDIGLAKEFMLIDDIDGDTIYISNDLNKILEVNDNSLVGVYGVMDSEDGEVLIHTGWNYSGEPIMMGRFLHKKFFINEYTTKNIVYL